jgi:hypothetical protein
MRLEELVALAYPEDQDTRRACLHRLRSDADDWREREFRAADGRWVEDNGIGLAIVRQAAERMGGSVGVESDGASGSRFWIELQGA